MDVQRPPPWLHLRQMCRCRMLRVVDRAIAITITPYTLQTTEEAAAAVTPKTTHKIIEKSSLTCGQRWAHARIRVGVRTENSEKSLGPMSARGRMARRPRGMRIIYSI